MQAINNMLELILIDPLNRERLARDYQKRIRNTTITDSDEIIKVYNDLADIMDYYEPDQEIRKEDPLNYGDDRLLLEVREALNKLKKF